MAPKGPEPSRITWCRALCPPSVFERPVAHVKLLGESISVFSPQKGTSPTKPENGPGGIQPALSSRTDALAASERDRTMLWRYKRRGRDYRVCGSGGLVLVGFRQREPA